MSSTQKKVLIGGALVSIVVGGGLYYFYRGRMLSADEIKEQGNRYFFQRKFFKAIDCYTRALERCDPTNVLDYSTLILKRAAVYEEMEDWKNVVEDCTSAMEINPKYFKALYCRGKAYANLGLKKTGLEDITLLIILDGFKNKLFLLLAEKIAKDIGKEMAAEYFANRPSILPSTHSIISYFNSFNYTLFDEVESGDVGSSEGDSVYQQILTKMKNNDYEGVVTLCDDVLSAGSKYRCQALLLRASFKFLMNDFLGAIEDLEAVINTKDDLPAQLQVCALIKRAGVKMHLGDADGCFLDLENALTVDDSNANIWHSKGQMNFHTGRFEDAKSDFQRAVKLDPSFVAPRIHLGYCLFQISTQAKSTNSEWVTIQKEANDILEETIQLFPDNNAACSIYGQMLQDQGHFQEASVMYDKAISLSHAPSKVFVHKALLLLQWQQDTDGAARLIRDAIQLDEKCDIGYVTLASLEAERGNDEEAIRLWKSSLPFVRTEAEMANTFALIEAAEARIRLSTKYQIVDSPSNWAVPPVA